MKRVLRHSVFSLLLYSAVLLHAENFRVSRLHAVELSGNSIEEKSIEIGINDSVAVFMPEDMTYVEGFELKIQIPQVVADWRDCVAMSVYDSVSPSPSEVKIDYSGTRVYVSPLPSKLNWIVQIPLKEKNFIKDSSYISKLNVVPDISDGNVFIRFQPAMKGVPDSTYESSLHVSVKPVLINKGKIKLSVQAPEKKSVEYELLIDDKPVKPVNDTVLLEKGSHSICVQTEDYRNEIRNVVVEQARTTPVSFVLKSLAPTLVVNAPANALVYVDGVRFEKLGKEVVIEEGQHNIRFNVGGYEVVRTLDVSKGKSYSANLMIDLEISEN